MLCVCWAWSGGNWGNGDALVFIRLLKFHLYIPECLKIANNQTRILPSFSFEYSNFLIANALLSKETVGTFEGCITLFKNLVHLRQKSFCFQGRSVENPWKSYRFRKSRTLFHAPLGEFDPLFAILFASLQSIDWAEKCEGKCLSPFSLT